MTKRKDGSVDGIVDSIHPGDLVRLVRSDTDQVWCGYNKYVGEVFEVDHVNPAASSFPLRCSSPNYPGLIICFGYWQVELVNDPEPTNPSKWRPSKKQIEGASILGLMIIFLGGSVSLFYFDDDASWVNTGLALAIYGTFVLLLRDFIDLIRGVKRVREK